VKIFLSGFLLFNPEFWSGDSCQSKLFSCSFISSLCSICSLPD
jgi:hypothetical protein